MVLSEISWAILPTLKYAGSWPWIAEERGLGRVLLGIIGGWEDMNLRLSWNFKMSNVGLGRVRITMSYLRSTFWFDRHNNFIDLLNWWLALDIWWLTLDVMMIVIIIILFDGGIAASAEMVHLNSALPSHLHQRHFLRSLLQPPRHLLFLFQRHSLAHR